MRYRVFIDTNILLSGIFFAGNESKVLDLLFVDKVTSVVPVMTAKAFLEAIKKGIFPDEL